MRATTLQLQLTYSEESYKTNSISTMRGTTELLLTQSINLLLSHMYVDGSCDHWFNEEHSLQAVVVLEALRLHVVN